MNTRRRCLSQAMPQGAATGADSFPRSARAQVPTKNRLRARLTVVVATVTIASLSGWGGATHAATSGSSVVHTQTSWSAPMTGRLAPVRMVEMGDSWIAGEHCDCTTFAGLWAHDIQEQTGHQVRLTDLTGVHERSPVQDKTSGSLLWSLRHDKQTQHIVADSDIVLVSTGGNDIEPIGDQLINSTCGGPDDAKCIRQLGRLWRRNFDHMVEAIGKLRGSKPTAIRLVAEGNFFLGSADLNSLVPPGFALSGGQLMAKLYVKAVCGAAKKYDAKCIDGRPILSGPQMDQPFDENAASTFRKLTDALDAESLPELGLKTRRPCPAAHRRV
jgi:hypothetical protein